MTNDELQEVERLAGLLMSPRDIAMQIEMTQEDFLHDLSNEFSDIHKAFHRGYLRTEMDIREKAFNPDREAPADYEEIQFKMKELNNFKAMLHLELKK